MTTYSQTIKTTAAPRNYTDDQKKKFKTDLKKMWEEEKQIVHGRFLCFEPRGGCVTFAFRKYEWDHPTQYTFKDGEEYDIPLSVARHLNGIDITAKAIDGKINTCAYAVHNYKQNASGGTSVDIGKYVRRYAFQTMGGENVG